MTPRIEKCSIPYSRSLSCSVKDSARKRIGRIRELAQKKAASGRFLSMSKFSRVNQK